MTENSNIKEKGRFRELFEKCLPALVTAAIVTLAGFLISSKVYEAKASVEYVNMAAVNVVQEAEIEKNIEDIVDLKVKYAEVSTSLSNLTTGISEIKGQQAKDVEAINNNINSLRALILKQK